MSNLEPRTGQSAPPDAYPRLSPLATGLRGRCPRCGKGRIFDGFLALRSRCDVCGLDLSVADTGDGPSFFASFLGSVIALGVAVYAQIAYEPPLWVYAIIVVLGGAFVVALIRPLKGLLTAMQFVNKAEQGRLQL
jgi:uncharacterized protein (DUF983 family)